MIRSFHTLKTIVSATVLSAVLLQNAAAQDAAPNEAVKRQAEINNAKANLESARQNRDRAIAVRWQEKKVANDAREAFNLKYQDARERLDLAASEKSRILEELRAIKAEMEQFKQDAEKARAEFIVLSSQDDKVESLERTLGASTPFNVPQRIQSVNQVKKAITLLKDKPERVLDSLFSVAAEEMAFSRYVETRKTDLIFNGNEKGYGLKMRLGGVGGIQYDADRKVGALLLSTTGERGKMYVWQQNINPEHQQAIQAAFTAPPGADTSVVLLPLDVLLSTSLNAEISNRQDLSWQDKAKKFIADGGVLMYPILGLFVLAILFSAERLVVWTMRNRTSRKAVRQIFTKAEEGKLEDAAKQAEKLGGSVGRIIRVVLEKRESKRSVAEKAVQEVLAHEIPALEKRLTTISVLGGAAPLLGLLGTVYGMIQLFEVITLYGTSDPKLLAGGISVALVTTETGLAVAIPVQLLHNYVSNRVNRLVSEMEKQALRFLNVIWIEE